MYNLAIYYQYGIGTEKNLERAFHWCQKAGENGNTVSLYILGEYYELGNGVEKDELKAFEYYKKSAENGYIDAIFYLGYCYIKGIGTEIDIEKGFWLYNEAAELLYDNDVKISDSNKINYWYYKAADNDNKVALYKLGEFYELGKGVSENLVRAFEFYKKSADRGYLEAHYKV